MAMRQNVIKVYSCFGENLIGVLTEIDVSISPGIPTFDIIGLCDSSIRESRGRIRAALISSGFQFPKGHITVGISPAYMRKSGSSFDLAIALGILYASRQLVIPEGSRIYAEGELSFEGALKSTPGASVRLKTQDNNFEYSFIPESSRVSGCIAGFRGMAVNTLREAADSIINNTYVPSSFDFDIDNDYSIESLDFSCLRGQEKASRAVLIAASGRHNLLLLGSSGCGKSLIADLIAGILPPLQNKELCDVFQVRESLGLINSCDSLSNIQRPVRYIHPGVTYSKIFGSKNKPNSSELVLANHGVLFADEICEFKKDIIEGLRIPLEDHYVRHSRDGNDYIFPASFIFIAAGNPCKCGLLYESNRRCRCSPSDKKNYLKRLSGPFLDRMDLFTEMRSINSDAMIQSAQNSDANLSLKYREMVFNAWQMQIERYKDLQEEYCFNGNISHIDSDLLRIPSEVLTYAADLSQNINSSGRGFNRTLRVARTIADIDGRLDVIKSDINEALMYRQRVING